MRKLTVTLLVLLCLFLGMVLGFLLAPVKGGFGNNSGNTTNNHYYNKEQEE